MLLLLVLASPACLHETPPAGFVFLADVTRSGAASN